MKVEMKAWELESRFIELKNGYYETLREFMLVGFNNNYVVNCESGMYCLGYLDMDDDYICCLEYNYKPIIIDLTDKLFDMKISITHNNSDIEFDEDGDGYTIANIYVDDPEAFENRLKEIYKGKYTED